MVIPTRTGEQILEFYEKQGLDDLAEQQRRSNAAVRLNQENHFRLTIRDCFEKTRFIETEDRWGKWKKKILGVKNNVVSVEITGYYWRTIGFAVNDKPLVSSAVKFDDGMTFFNAADLQADQTKEKLQHPTAFFFSDSCLVFRCNTIQHLTETL